MSSFEWMELQSLSADIAEARKRLAEARSLKDDRVIRSLEQEITAAEAQRARIVMQLSTHFADNPAQGGGESAPEAETTKSELNRDASTEDGITVSEWEKGELSESEKVVPEEEALRVAEIISALEVENEPESPPQTPAVPTGDGDPAPPAASVEDDNPKGGTIVWDQLTPSDLERAKEALVSRRTEMLARHAEELKALEADGNQLEELERAISAFLRRFTSPPSDAEVVKLGEERELRLGRG